MNRHIKDFVAMCPKYQQVDVEHQKPEGVTQAISIPTWKWEVINTDLIRGLTRTRIQYDSIWVNWTVTMSAHHLAVKTTDFMEYYARITSAR
ncbi:hypothetical protein MTR67_030996 [Solanum verrucosum]|uniref:Uncharacterized protein n=1 Tax=Solanum verrucosum TaxID=315347 RepID=A0AAF0U1N2_SOLVR|nr:hypothetical protein MTR67_030996 [Solanum verrucosum]